MPRDWPASMMGVESQETGAAELVIAGEEDAEGDGTADDE